MVEAVDTATCILLTGADALETIAIYRSMLMMDFRVEGSNDNGADPRHCGSAPLSFG